MTFSYDSSEEPFNAWKLSRFTSVTSPLGNLALIETRWLGEGERKDDAEVGLPETVQVTELQRKNITTGEPERGLRFWDSKSEGILKFKEISTFPFDPSWVIRGRFNPAPAGRTVPFEHLRDNGLSRPLTVPGDIDIEISGEHYQLHAFDDGGKLLLTFADATGHSKVASEKTYLPGRFLFVQKADGDEVILDFNRAFIPPCGFSYAYNCPLPPPQNIIKAAIRAGEIQIVSH